MSDNFEQWKAEDGIIDAEMFLAQKIKILWVLREPNGVLVNRNRTPC